MSDTPSEDHTESATKADFEKALADFYSVFLAVVYHPDVILPTHLMTPAWKARLSVVHLEYGIDMAIPITDMVITDAGVAATLSFSREPFATFVPWAAVKGIGCDGERPPAPKPRPKLGLVK
jgi:hypothetical protein